MNQSYLDTVRLLLDVAPAVFRTPNFAIKGGTAINLFVQDLPRLSVDIDVAFTDYTMDRESALNSIAAALGDAKTEIGRLGYEAAVKPTQQGDEAKMFIYGPSATVKVEVNFVFRGTVLPTVTRPLTPATQELFSLNVSLPLLDTAELYGGKLVAAMDRQHPRDMYDVHRMLESFGLQPTFVDCFVAYLAGHNRPVHEVLFPRPKPLEALFTNEFQGMTNDSVEFELLAHTQAKILHLLPRMLTADHRRFLVSLVKLEPAWDLMPFAHLQELPALRWKLQNLAKLKGKNPTKFAEQHRELAARFDTLQ